MDLWYQLIIVIFGTLSIALIVYFVVALVRDHNEKLMAHKRLEDD